MGNVASSPVAQCLQGPELAKRMEMMETQLTKLIQENERLRKELQEKETAAAAEEASAKSGGAPMLRRAGSLVYGSDKFSKRTDDDSTLTSAAAIVAAAEATANYQRSLVHVSVKNAPESSMTLVTVRAPNRRQLLGDMAGALAGLGLTVHAAGIQAESTPAGANSPAALRRRASDMAMAAEMATLRFSLLEAGRRVTDAARLRLIEQRLQHASTGRYTAHPPLPHPLPIPAAAAAAASAAASATYVRRRRSVSAPPTPRPLCAYPPSPRPLHWGYVRARVRACLAARASLAASSALWSPNRYGPRRCGHTSRWNTSGRRRGRCVLRRP